MVETFQVPQKWVGGRATGSLCSPQCVQILSDDPAFSLNCWAVLRHLQAWRLPYGSSAQSRPSQHGATICNSSWKLPGTEDTFYSQILTDWRGSFLSQTESPPGKAILTEAELFSTAYSTR